MKEKEDLLDRINKKNLILEYVKSVTLCKELLDNSTTERDTKSIYYHKYLFLTIQRELLKIR